MRQGRHQVVSPPAAAEHSECYHLVTSAHVKAVVGTTADRDGCDFLTILHGPAANCYEYFAGFGGTLACDMHLGGWATGPAVARVSGSSGKAVSTQELLCKWRILPFHLLLAQRRFGWLQSMVKAPQHSEQVVAALFGRLEVASTDWCVQLSSLGC